MTSSRSWLRTGAVGLVRGVPDQRRPENLLRCPKHRAVRVVNRIRVTSSLAEWREDDHADRSVAAHALVPGDEDRPAGLVGGRIEDLGDLIRQPGVALQNRVVQRSAGIVHVVTQIGSDEYVPSDVVGREVGGKLGVGAHVGDAIRGAGTVRVGHVIEINKWIVLGRVKRARRQRARRSADVLLVRFPRNTGAVELGHQVGCCALMIHAWVAIVRNAKIGSGFEP